MKALSDIFKIIEKAYGFDEPAPRAADPLRRTPEEIAAEKRKRDADLWAETARTVLAHGPLALAELPRGTLAALVPGPLRRFCATWDALSGGALVLGPTGCGKSVSAAYSATLLKLTSPSRFVVWASACDLANARKRYPLGEGEAPAVDRACRADVLYLDDLGWEPEADSTVREVLSARYDAGRASCVTSGFSAAELERRYSAAVMRRVLEAGGKTAQLFDLFPRN